jgi:hypothetical protein
MPEKQNRSFDQASLTLTLSNPSTHPLSHHLQAHTWIGKYSHHGDRQTIRDSLLGVRMP